MILRVCRMKIGRWSPIAAYLVSEIAVLALFYLVAFPFNREGDKVIKTFFINHVDFYTSDGYWVCKTFDTSSEVEVDL